MHRICRRRDQKTLRAKRLQLSLIALLNACCIADGQEFSFTSTRGSAMDMFELHFKGAQQPMPVLPYKLSDRSSRTKKIPLVFKVARGGMLLHILWILIFSRFNPSFGFGLKILQPTPLQVIDRNDIFLLVHVPSNHIEKHVCVTLQNTTEKHARAERTIISECLVLDERNDAHTAHIRIELASSGFFALSVSTEKFNAANLPRGDALVHDTVLFQVQPSEVFHHSRSNLILLSPLNRAMISSKRLEIFFFNYAHTSLPVCFDLDHGSQITCVLPNSVQPVVFYDLFGSFHVLKAWTATNHSSADSQFTQTIIFSSITNEESTRSLRLASPVDGDLMGSDNVWLKFDFAESYFSHEGLGMFFICFRISKLFFSCDGQANEPMRLLGLVPGKYTVEAWLATHDHLEISGSRVFARFSVSDAIQVLPIRDIRSRQSEVPLITAGACKSSNLYTVFVFAFQRVLLLRRLWQSLLNAHYFQCNVDVKIFVDRARDAETWQSVRLEVQQMKWPHGKLNIILRSTHVGLVGNILSAWEPPNNHRERAIFLEDDVEVSPWFFYFLMQIDRRGIKLSPGSRMLGISLYRPKWNDISWHNIKYAGLSNSSQPFFMMQLPCSWGAMYFPEEWNRFLRWHKTLEHAGAFDSHVDQMWLPRSMSNVWQVSWKKTLLRFMVEESVFMAYPSSGSFSTSKAPVGENVATSLLSSLYNVQLIANLDFSLLNLTNSSEKLNPPDVYYDFYQHPARRKNDQHSYLRHDTVLESSMSCLEQSGSTVCSLRHVVLEKENQVSLFRKLNGCMKTFHGPLIVPSLRHRCCMEEIPFINAKVIEGSLSIGGRKMCHSTVENAYLFAAVNFPQYGHTIHDTLFSLFDTIHTVPTSVNTSAIHTLIISNFNDSNLYSVSDIARYESFFRALGKGGVYMLEELAGGHKRTCVSNLVVGLSAANSFYDSRQAHAKHDQLKRFVMAYRFSLGIKTENSRTSPVLRATFIKRRNRRVLNAQQLYDISKDVGYNTSIVSLEFLSFRQQVELMEETNLLVGVTGSGLFNAIFMATGTSVIILFPYGTRPWMGQNLMQLAASNKRNAILLEANEPKKSVLYSCSYLHDSQSIWPIWHPDQIWRRSWLFGFNLFMRQDFYINATSFRKSVFLIYNSIGSDADEC